ncbi:hypothetical protein C0J52_27144 [Blattella germanica]|nr:hypothetical protein C0J52_27144 [Blattella germanica]
MIVSPSEMRRARQVLQIGHKKFEGMIKFCYLGNMIDNELKMRVTVMDRIQAGNRAYYATLKLLKNKLQIYLTLIRPVVTYGAETWTLTKEDQNSLRKFERKR